MEHVGKPGHQNRKPIKLMPNNLKKPVLASRLIRRARAFFRKFVTALNHGFNKRSLKGKRAVVILFGLITASLCSVLVIDSIYGEVGNGLPADRITLPYDIYLNTLSDTSKLTLIGKIKNETNGRVDSFYLAIDHAGTLFISRDSVALENMHTRSDRWQPTTPQELGPFEIQLPDN
jgi:hypothetical protein